MAESLISKRSSMAVTEDDHDATPRILRVMNPNRSEASSRVTSHSSSRRSRSISLQSISGSFSSLWHSRSCIPSLSSRRTPSPSSSATPSCRRVPLSTMASGLKGGEVAQRPNPLQPPPMGLPAVGTLRVTTSSFVVGEGAGRKPVAYVIFDMTCWAQNALQRQLRSSQRGSPARQLDTEPGELSGLRATISIEGPATQQAVYGPQFCQFLRVEDRWIVVVKLGMKENKLASKITTPVRSRSDKSTSMALIDQFLSTLEGDSKRSEPVYVRIVVTYRHSFFPEDTLIETGSVCTVGPLTITSALSALENTALPSSIVHALDPGPGNFIHLYSDPRPDHQVHNDLPPEEGQAMIEAFRHIFGHSIPRLVDTDLTNLGAYYYFRSRHDARSVKTSPFRKSINRAKTAMSKLSLRKKNAY